MRIKLADHFTFIRLLRFTGSTILMLIFTSMYSIVDGFFVSNYVGKTALAAINLVIPISMGISSVGFMLGSGGCAIISKCLGEGKGELASRYFSMLVYVTLILSAGLSVLCVLFTPQIVRALGASGALMESCLIYGRILFITQTAFILQIMFQNFFVAAEKPKLSFAINLIAGLANVVLDYLFIAGFKWGIAGAAAATGIGQMIGGIYPIFYFARSNDSLLHLTRKTKLYGAVLLKACANGSSEMVSKISASVVGVLYNFQLMWFAGEDGVAAFGVILYMDFIFTAVFIGYAIGSAPIVSYHYGVGNHGELKSLFSKSLWLLGAAGVLLTLLAELLAKPLVKLFAGYDAKLFAMTVYGFQIYSLAFLMMGINIWGSAFFTALNDGIVSAAISFLRTFVFQCAVLLLLPILFGMNGVWWAISAAELLSLAVTVTFFVGKRKKYRYG